MHNPKVLRTEQEIMQQWGGDEKPLVSISCITYNHEDYIAEAIEGFLMQETDFPFEVLVHDDCSTDDTAKVIRKYENKYPHIIKPIYQQENQYSKGIKPSVTFNYPRSKGRYIAVCEGDDYWTDPKKLQIQIEYMRKYPKCCLSVHPASEVIDGQVTKKVYCDFGSETKIYSPEFMLQNSSFASTASLLFCRDALLPALDLFSIAPVGDDFTRYITSSKEGALYIAKNMSNYRRMHTGSFMSVMRAKKSQSVEKMLEITTSHLLKYINALKEMKKYVNKDENYSNEVDKKIALEYYYLAILFIRHERFNAFKEYIVLSHRTYQYLSFNSTVLYYLRFFPKTLYKLIKIKGY